MRRLFLVLPLIALLSACAASDPKPQEGAASGSAAPTASPASTGTDPNEAKCAAATPPCPEECELKDGKCVSRGVIIHQ